ncbi:hypothetical protein Pyn_26101 [Prunus yedoensis var. nudiflora]|uniref:Uncharacterized protein n=1 Tax=Prunus yedoensis var. nudiflora TaxID=2094558 RepID=A0A314Y292_PRUYE|nr:hypothetical protein Pyn_26101 [Prunus yedoensis var. nudiflora]
MPPLNSSMSMSIKTHPFAFFFTSPDLSEFNAFRKLTLAFPIFLNSKGLRPFQTQQSFLLPWIFWRLPLDFWASPSKAQPALMAFTAILPELESPPSQQFGLFQMTCQFNEDRRAWHDDPTTAESKWLNTLVTLVAEVTALTKVGGKAPTIARMTTAYHVQSDNAATA